MSNHGGAGKNRKADKLKVLQGTFRPDRAKPEQKAKVTPQAPPRAPAGLSSEAQKLWRTVVNGWDLDESGLVILRQVCENSDRLRQSQEILEADGLVVHNARTGAPAPHPMIKTERDCRETFIKLWRLLNLE